MIIVDPVVLGSATPTRASPGTFFDAAGILRTAAPNEFRVTFDPSAPAAPPQALFEGSASNQIRNNTMIGGEPGKLPTNWSGDGSSNGITVTVHGVGVEDGVSYVEMSYVGTATAAATFAVNSESPTLVTAAVGQAWVGSIFARVLSGERPSGLQLVVAGRTAIGASTNAATVDLVPKDTSLPGQRCSIALAIARDDTAYVSHAVLVSVAEGESINFHWRIGMPQLESDRISSVIPTAGAAATRAADVMPTGAALLYSNVPIPEPSYSATTTYAAGALVLDPISQVVYESLGANNLGNALTNTTKWVSRGATNRWKMLDAYNNTQTEAADMIVLAVTPQMISQGFYLGNLDANEVSIVVQDRVDGVVHVETQNLVVPDAGGSYFKWFFKRIRRKSYAVSVLLPVYVNAIMTICIRKTGSVAKCGMCAIGQLVDVGLSQYGLGTEIKDYSSTTFNFDGTSQTVVRGYSKRMSIDVEIDNEAIDAVQENLAALRQKPVVWIGAVAFGSAIVFGKYSSFKNIVESQPLSKMALQIEGTV